MDLEGIERLTPEQRIEVQEWLLLRDAKQRDFRASGQPDRRRAHVPRWYSPRRWGSNAVPPSMRNMRPVLGNARRPGSKNYGNQNWKGRGASGADTA